MVNWSRNAAHIQSLFRPWQSGDGCTESTIINAEQRLAARLPTQLRNFYLKYGQRPDLMQSNDKLLTPQAIFRHVNHLVFCVENQAACFWGIPLEWVAEDDPPVDCINNEDTEEQWQISHTHLSDFLDAVLLKQAFSGGAMHGATLSLVTDRQKAIETVIKQHYEMVRLGSNPWYRPVSDALPWTLYIGPHIAIDMSTINTYLIAAVGTKRAILDLQNLLGLQWDEAW